jgi:hypothetical protein
MMGGGTGGFGGIGGMGGGMRSDWGIVWKLANKKDLVPVRVRQGVTDFTFTELKDGELKEGDELVIGQSTSKNNTSTSGQQNRAPGMGGGPMGGPGGMPRRM